VAQPDGFHTDWDDFELYGWFAEHYQWTAQQVDDTPYWLLVRYRRYSKERERVRYGL